MIGGHSQSEASLRLSKNSNFQGKVYPNQMIKYMCCLSGTVYDFKGTHVAEIVSRRRQVF